MNHGQADQLMGRIASAYGRGFTDATRNEWRHHLTRTDPDAAHTALDRIVAAGEPGPSIARLIAEVGAIATPHSPRTPGRPECEGCDGGGFREAGDRWGIIRAVACPLCRPDQHRADMDDLAVWPEPVWTIARRKGLNRE